MRCRFKNHKAAGSCSPVRNKEQCLGPPPLTQPQSEPLIDQDGDRTLTWLCSHARGYGMIRMWRQATVFPEYA